MLGKIVTGLSTFVIGYWSKVLGEASYEGIKAYCNYRFFDEKSPGYHYKNGSIFFKEKKGKVG